MNNPPITAEEIAANQARVNAKPSDAVLMEAPYDVADGSGHRITRGSLAWRSRGKPRWDGPPIAGQSVGIATDHWTCRSCARRKGWDDAPRDTTICRSCGCEYWLHWPENDGCSVSIDNDHYCDCKGFVGHVS